MLTRTVDGAAVREIRERKGLSVKDVRAIAATHGVDVSLWTLYRLEQGRSQPSAKKAVAIAKALGCDQDEIFVKKNAA